MHKTLKCVLWRPRGMGWGGRWDGGSGWGTHVNPWLIHVNVWQKPLQYYKVISLQLIKINGKKKCIISCSVIREVSSSVHGIFQARVLEWVAISFPRGSFPPRDHTQVSHIAGTLLSKSPGKPKRGITVTLIYLKRKANIENLNILSKFVLQIGDPNMNATHISWLQNGNKEEQTQLHAWAISLALTFVLSYCA